MKPNIIFILFDDLGTNMVDTPQGRTLGLYDGRDQSIKTPQMYDLAEKGVFFYRNLATVPVCMPSRYAFLTGIKSGSKWSRIRGNTGDNDEPDLHSAGEISIAMELKRTGYATAMFGKYHFGSSPSVGGFDYALHMSRFVDKEFPRYFPEYINEDSGNGNVLTSKYTGKNINIGIDSYASETTKCNLQGETCDYAPDIYHNMSLKWIEDKIDKNIPFFCYLPFLAPHDAKQKFMPVPRIDGPVVDYSSSIYNGYFAKMKQLASAVTNYADVRIGEIRDLLISKGVHENTLIIITSDNGGTDSIASTDDQSAKILQSNDGYRANWPYRGKKRHLMFGGSSVPTIAYWPSKFPANSILNHNTEIADLSRTILEIAQVHNINKQFNGLNLYKDLENADNTNFVSDLSTREFIVNEICLDDEITFGKHHNCDFIVTFNYGECKGLRIEWTGRNQNQLDMTIRELDIGYTSRNGGMIGNLTLDNLRYNGYDPIVYDTRNGFYEDNIEITQSVRECINKAEQIVLNYRIVPTSQEQNIKIKEYQNYNYAVPSFAPTSPSSSQGIGIETLYMVLGFCSLSIIITLFVVALLRYRRRQYKVKTYDTIIK